MLIDWTLAFWAADMLPPRHPNDDDEENDEYEEEEDEEDEPAVIREPDE
jgi:hypothetical protein